MCKLTISVSLSLSISWQTAVVHHCLAKKFGVNLLIPTPTLLFQGHLWTVSANLFCRLHVPEDPFFTKDLIPCWFLRRAISQRATTMVRGKQWKAGTQNEESKTRVNQGFSLSHRVAFIVQNILVHEGAATSKKPSVTNRPPTRYLI